MCTTCLCVVYIYIYFFFFSLRSIFAFAFVGTIDYHLVKIRKSWYHSLFFSLPEVHSPTKYRSFGVVKPAEKLFARCFTRVSPRGNRRSRNHREPIWKSSIGSFPRTTRHRIDLREENDRSRSRVGRVVRVPRVRNYESRDVARFSPIPGSIDCFFLFSSLFPSQSTLKVFLYPCKIHVIGRMIE